MKLSKSILRYFYDRQGKFKVENNSANIQLGAPVRQRERVSMFSSPTCEPVRKKKTPVRRLIPGQTLITGIWTRWREKVVNNVIGS